MKVRLGEQKRSRMQQCQEKLKQLHDKLLGELEGNTLKEGMSLGEASTTQDSIATVLTPHKAAIELSSAPDELYEESQHLLSKCHDLVTTVRLRIENIALMKKTSDMAKQDMAMVLESKVEAGKEAVATAKQEVENAEEGGSNKEVKTATKKLQKAAAQPSCQNIFKAQEVGQKLVAKAQCRSPSSKGVLYGLVV